MGDLGEKKDEMERLILQAKSGDSLAFGQIYDIYVDKIYKFAYFRTFNKQNAEDITHQVFLKAWEKISSFKEIGASFSAWLFKIARNTLTDFYRKSDKNLQSIDVFSDTNAAFEDSVDLEKIIENKNLKKDLMAAVDKLPLEQKEVITLRFINDLNSREIAAIIGKSEGNVRVIQYRALKKLREIMKEKFNY